MSNIPPFYTGQRVVCVKGSPKHGLYEGKTYTLTDVKMCECGCCQVSWGSKAINGSGGFNCAGCDKDFGNTGLDEWYGISTRFRPAQEQRFPLIEYKKVLEEVPVGAN